MTGTGNLSRAVLAEMIEVVEWPGLDKNKLFRMNKVINEPDFPWSDRQELIRGMVDLTVRGFAPPQ